MATRVLALFITLPDATSPPRLRCAFISLSLSASKIGTNRRAIVIIIANSCAGSPHRLNGESKLSMPSASSIGVVVKVSRPEKLISATNRSNISKPRSMPSTVSVKNSHCHKTCSPGVTSIFIAQVSASRKINPRTAASALVGGILASHSAPKPNAYTRPKTQNSFTQKMPVRKASIPSSLARGSSLCTGDSTG